MNVENRTSLDSEEVPKLSDITCHLITRREDLTRGALKYLPPKFVPNLLRFALETMSYESAKMLLQNFKGDVVSLRRIGVAISDNADLNRISTGIIRAFFESLEARVPLAVKTIDVTGFPISGPGLSYLSVQGILAYTESQKSKVLKVVEQAKEKGRISGEQADPFGDLSIQSTLAPGAYSIMFDCCISEESVVKNIAQALKVSQWFDRNSAGPSVRLGVQRIQFSELCFQHTIPLLELLNPEHLRGLKFHFCYFLPGEDGGGVDDAWLSLATQLQQFHNLDSLELNGLGLVMEGDNEIALRVLVQRLNRLERLSFYLDEFPVGRLRLILAECRRPLKLLCLQGCSLSPLDLMWLSQASVHTSSLTELNLSDNPVVSEELTTTCCLLKACRRTIEKVRLSRCNFRDQHLDRIIANLAMADRLNFVDLRFNMFEDPQWVCDKFVPLASHPRLETIVMSVPRTFLPLEERGIFECQFRANLTLVMLQQKAPHRRRVVSVIFTAEI